MADTSNPDVCSNCGHGRDCHISGGKACVSLCSCAEFKEPLVYQQDQKREYQMAEIMGLQHNLAESGVDGISRSGMEWELKSTGVTKNFNGFCIGRDLSLKKVEWCETQYWGFAFYTDKSGDEIYRMVFVHPRGLEYRWSFLKKKFTAHDRIIDCLTLYAIRGMQLDDYTEDEIIDVLDEIEPIFERGGRQLRQNTVAKGDLDNAIHAGLGYEVDLEGDIPAQLLAFEMLLPLDRKND